MENIKENYAVKLGRVNFSNSNSLNWINDQIKRSTNGLFENALGDGINEDTKLALINTIYFKADWLNPFDSEDTYSRTFHNINGSKSKEIPFLFGNADYDFKIVEDLKIRIFKIPYVADKSMIIIVPFENDGLDAVRKTLFADPLKFENLLTELEETNVDLSLPKFSFKTELNLKNIFKGMGINKPFEDGANFEAITSTKEPLKVDSAFHKAFISVSEKGTEAGAVSVAGLINKMMPRQYTIDHPFMFIIRDETFGMNLFQGFVTKL